MHCSMMCYDVSNPMHACVGALTMLEYYTPYSIYLTVLHTAIHINCHPTHVNRYTIAIITCW